MRRWSVCNRAEDRRWLALLALLLAGPCLVPLAAQADTAPMVSVRSRHTLALSADGRVLAWGSDQNGQLGSGAQTFDSRPGVVAGLGSVATIASGGSHSLAVDGDGAVWTWGSNDAGQLGDGSTADKSVPARVPGLADVVEACGGGSYSLARRRDGTVWGWGSNHDLVLGNPGLGESRSPVQVKGLTSAVALACGDHHALALRSDGALLAWGRNGSGALGLGHTTDRPLPTPILTLSRVKAIAAGQESSLALRQDGTVWEWGASNPYATPPAAARTSPVQLPGIERVAQISAGSYFHVAVGEDKRTWWQWTTGDRPQAQASVGEVTASARHYGQGFLLVAGGSVLGFGGGNGNGFGNLGDGTVDYREAPAPVVDITGIVQVATGTWYGMALGADGRVWTWGLDASGQLGRARFLARSVPALVPGPAAVTQVSAGHDHSMAVDRDGKVWAWGGNGYAQLGNGTWTDSGAPQKLTTIEGVGSVLSGAFHTLALKLDGTLWGWGSALPGAPLENPAQPTQLFDQAAGMASGSSHVVAVRRDGSVWAWGDNDAGQLGDGTLGRRLVPGPVVGLGGVVAVAASGRSNWALRSDGSVWAWGDNERGQLGDGTRTRRLQPVAVAGLTGVVELVVGSQHALARRSDGAVFGWWWGDELWGELGLAQDQAGHLPRLLQIPPGRLAGMAAGDSISAFLGDEGRVVMGGRNDSGQVGDGSLATAMRPVFVVNPEATGLLNLVRLDAPHPAVDPRQVLLRATRGREGLAAVLTDLRAVGIAADVYFTALVPPNSPLLAQAMLGRRARPASGSSGMSPISISQAGVKQLGPTTTAQPASTGTLNAGDRLQVYGADLQDPLAGSNALICIGVTVPELSAKGQVLVRPLATGDQVSGVAQCPPVQTPATLQLYTGQSTGPITARTITATLTPLDEDRGRLRQVYSWAVAPDGRQFMQTVAGWAAMAEPVQPALTLVVPTSGTITLPVTNAMDLSTLVGTLVYIGLGSSWEEVRSLNKAGHYDTVR